MRLTIIGDFQGLGGKESACNAGDIGDENSTPGLGRSLVGGNDTPLQYSCLDNPWTEEPDELQSVRSQRVGHDWKLTSSHWHHHYHDNKHCQHLQVLHGLKQSKSLVFCRVVHLLQFMNLHWHIIIIWSSWFTLGFTFAIAHSICLNRCIMLCGIIQNIFHCSKKILFALPIYPSPHHNP